MKDKVIKIKMTDSFLEYPKSLGGVFIECLVWVFSCDFGGGKNALSSIVGVKSLVDAFVLESVQWISLKSAMFIQVTNLR